MDGGGYLVSQLIVTNTPYQYLKQPWIIFEGVKGMVWKMYKEYAAENNNNPIPSWYYYCEDENDYCDFHDSVFSYLTFGDFEHHKWLDTDSEIEQWYLTIEQHGTALDQDFVMLFDEMRLVMEDSAGEYTHFPIVQVW